MVLEVVAVVVDAVVVVLDVDEMAERFWRFGEVSARTGLSALPCVRFFESRVGVFPSIFGAWSWVVGEPGGDSRSSP